MKYLFTSFIILMLIPMTTYSQNNPEFNNFFLNKTFRIDYYHTGDKNSELITLDRIYRYGIWAGSTKNLIDRFNNGKYYAKVYDLNTGRLIFSKGYDSYFGEYETSTPAAEGIKRTYSESVLIPAPKNAIRFEIERRNRENKLEKIFSCKINPSDVDIIKDNLRDGSIKVFKEVVNGDPHDKVDIAVLAEGYTRKETNKFKIDLNKFVKTFLNQEPYKSYKDRFNIYGVFKASQESGVDEPTHNVYKNTALSCTFNSLGSERYLLTEDNKAVRKIAAQVPYDAIYIMVNHNRYGGGGIYNLYCTFTADNQWTGYLLLHEFGHSFAGLADEYYTSDVAYNDFYPQAVEPVEPNITALLDPQNIKWKKLLTPGIEVPTPWKKAEYDSLDLSWQKNRRELMNKIAEEKRSGANPETLRKLENEYNKGDRKHAKEMDKFLTGSKYWGKVGAFEGAGYASKGLYRPMLDCIMFSKGNKPYCKVCEAAIIRMIKFYSE